MPSASKTKVLGYDTTLHVRDSCLCLHAQRAARSIARRFDEALRPFGLTNGQFSLLISLNRPEPPGMQAVATLLGLDRTTLTAALKPLIRTGLVKCNPDPQDRRGKLISLTARAHALLLEAVPVWRKTQSEVEALVNVEKPETLRRQLRELS